MHVYMSARAGFAKARALLSIVDIFQGVYNYMLLIFILHIILIVAVYFLQCAFVLILKCVLGNITHYLFMHFEDIFCLQVHLLT